MTTTYAKPEPLEGHTSGDWLDSAPYELTPEDHKDLREIVQMLTYRRPRDSKTEAKFCAEYLTPVFGEPDAIGNYVLHVLDPKTGKIPNRAFMAHGRKV